jgi:hypothetical protein
VGPLGYPERPRVHAGYTTRKSIAVERQRPSWQDEVDVDEAIGAKRGPLGIPSGPAITPRTPHPQTSFSEA